VQLVFGADHLSRRQLKMSLPSDFLASSSIQLKRQTVIVMASLSMKQRFWIATASGFGNKRTGCEAIE
jgi:hypothetical protein